MAFGPTLPLKGRVGPTLPFDLLLPVPSEPNIWMEPFGFFLGFFEKNRRQRRDSDL